MKNFSRTSLKLAVFAAALFAILPACKKKDVPASEQTQANAQQSLAQAQLTAEAKRKLLTDSASRVLGTFTGSLVSRKENSAEGAAIVEFERIRSFPSDTMVTLQGKFYFQNQTRDAFEFRDSTYDVNTHEFVVDLKVVRGTGSADTYSIRATLEEGSFEGGIEIQGYSSTGADFKLARVSKGVAEIQEQVQSLNSAIAENEFAAGRDEIDYSSDGVDLNDPRGAKAPPLPQLLAIHRAQYADFDKLADFLMPYEIVDLNLTIGFDRLTSVYIKLANAHWDPEHLVLIGEDTGTGMRVQCDPYNGGQMLCRHYTKENQVVRAVFHQVKSTPPQLH